MERHLPYSFIHILLFLLSATPAHAQICQDEPTFDRTITMEADAAYSVYAADVDGDGDVDVLSASFNDDKIAWYENTDGQGTFGAQQVISTAADGASSVYAADVDGDGDLDVLSASNNDDKIAWYENTDGQGTFSNPQVISTTADGALSVYAADVDGDGDVDVLSASAGDDKIAWYENTDGQGTTFSAPQAISTTANAASSVYAADVDGDGDLDVLSASVLDNKITWYENTDGAGTFGAPQIISMAANGAFSVYAADVDGDGNLDVLSASSYDDKIAWYENTDGQGTFGAQQVISTAADGAFSVYAADLDGDGDVDVLSASRDDDKIAWYENTDGQGTFSNPQVISTTADYALSVYAVDVDGDGDVDVLSASNNDDKITWYENTDGQGTFRGAQQVISTAADGANSVYAVDVDGDGDVDVLSASADDNKIAWYENTDGQGSFGAQQVISTAADGANSVYAADVDGDGDVDVLSASDSDFADKIAWYENTDGQGTFGAQQVISTAADGANSVYAADVDGDGDIDVLSASASDFDGKIAWYENTDGQGSFGAQQVIYTTFYLARSVHAADLDGDGDVDVLSASVIDDKIAWYENTDGAGTFGPPKEITTSADLTQSIYAADVDGDGDLDVLSASALDDKIAWYENTDGQGTFGPQQVISTAADGAQSVYAADVDGDGDLDVLSASYSDDKIARYENTDGQGSFGAQQVITTAADGANSVYAADVDGDGDLDVLFTSRLDNKIAWYENTCIHCPNPPTFTDATITTSTDGAESVYAADVDGDGDVDVLSASLYDDKIAWYENTDGAGTFGAQQVITTSADVARSVYAADVDGDGDVDVLSASGNDNKIAWYENTDGQGNFGAPQVISTAANGARSVYAADVDGDGDVDVLSASQFDNKIAWYENTDGQGSFGAPQVISTATDGAVSVYAADVDGDGDLDVLSASLNDDKIAWYENTDGRGSFGAQQVISTAADVPWSVYAADVDGDGDVDVLSASAGDAKIAWYENTDGAGSFGAQQVISTAADAANSVYAADVDGDGDIDVLSASSFDDKIAWYENTDGAGSFGSQQVISTAADFAQSVYAADVDGDGDLDVLSASQSDDKIAWYENTCVACTAALSGEATTCPSQTTNLSVTVTDGRGDFTVKIDSDGDMTAEITINDYTSGADIPVSPAATTTYTLLSVRDNSNGLMCEITTNQTTVTVNVNPTITLGISPAVCQGTTSADLSYTNTTANPDEYMIDYDATAEGQGFSDVAFTALPGSPISLTVPAAAAPDTYNATIKVRNSTTGCLSSEVAFTVTVNANPTITLGAGPAVCPGTTSADLPYTNTTANPDEYMIDYDATAEGQGFSDVAFTALPGSPISLTMPAAAAPDTYNATIKVRNTTTGCVSSAIAFTVTVNANPTITLGASPAVCPGTTSADLPYTNTTANPDEYMIDYDATAEGQGFSDVAFTALPGSPISLTVPAAAAPDTYNATIKVRNTTTGCVSLAIAFTVTVNANPTITLGAGPAVCPGTTSADLPYTNTTASPDEYMIDYEATAEGQGFSDVAFTTLPGSPISLTVPAAAAPDTYNATIKVRNSTTGCVSSAIAFTVTVNANPTITLGASPAVCQGTTSADLPYTNTTANPDEYMIDYDATSEGQGFLDVAFTALPSSPIPLTIPASAAPDTYNATIKVRNTTTGCVSSQVAFTVTYHSDCQTCSSTTIELTEDPVKDSTYQASDTIISTVTIDQNLTISYKAGSTIILRPNFTVLPGSTFTAKIEDCPATASSHTIEYRESTSIPGLNSSIRIYPNPFSTATTIEYELSKASRVQLHILDIAGRMVETLVPEQWQAKGQYQKEWRPDAWQTGMYFLVAQIGGERKTEKLILVRR